MSLGRSLMNSKQRTLNKGKIIRDEKMLQLQLLADEQKRHEEANVGKKRLKSIWETTNLDDFLTVADERADGYTAARDVRVVVGGASHVVSKNRVVPLSDNRRDWVALSSQLEIPHRPDWTFKTSAAELQLKEKSMFVEWRRKLAAIEESTNTVLTPYEKNLEVWRQLWRVVERSDVVVQIVDARNPLSFRCMDLERVVTAQNAQHNPREKKRVLLLLNKADLLHEEQRKAWAQYFAAQGVLFLFFSAKEAEEDQAAEAEEQATEAEVDAAVEAQAEAAIEAAAQKAEARNARRSDKRRLKGAPIRVDNIYAHSPKDAAAAAAQAAEAAKRKFADPTDEELERDARAATLRERHQPHDIVDPSTLLDILAAMRGILGVPAGEQLMAGMVGYPNVGKSSTINALIKSHKVVVSATPGKTKHFQTLTIPGERRVMLCDCPGLVFPSFASTREAMVCDGVLPIDTVKDYVSPVALVCKRIPQIILEQMYRVVIDQATDVDDSSTPAELLLNLVARRRGYMSDHDKPNRSKAAKDMLKDYVDGRIVFVHPPPGFAAPDAAAASIAPDDDDDPHPAAGGSTHEVDDDDDAGAEEDWEDVDSADEARNMSDDGESASEEDDDDAAENPVLFYDAGRKAKAQSRGVSAAEAFNAVRNIATCDELAAALDAVRSSKRKARNPQLEPDPFVRTTKAGETELLIDSDDDIEAVAGDPSTAPKAARGPSKKQLRRAAKHGTGAGARHVVEGAGAVDRRRPISLKM